jgi:hypothetical protein
MAQVDGPASNGIDLSSVALDTALSDPHMQQVTVMEASPIRSLAMPFVHCATCVVSCSVRAIDAIEVTQATTFESASTRSPAHAQLAGVGREQSLAGASLRPSGSDDHVGPESAGCVRTASRDARVITSVCLGKSNTITAEPLKSNLPYNTECFTWDQSCDLSTKLWCVTGRCLCYDQLTYWNGSQCVACFTGAYYDGLACVCPPYAYLYITPTNSCRE